MTEMQIDVEIDMLTGEVVFTPVFVRSANNYNMDHISDATGLKCPEPTLAQQNFKDETDINVIVQRFGLTGQLPTDLKTPIQGDFTAVTDFKSAMDMVILAQETFGALPASIRTRFQNDPNQFLDFVSDDQNRDEAKKMGLLVPESPPPEPIKVEVVEKKV